LTRLERLAASDKGAGLVRASVKTRMRLVRFGRKVEVEPMEGALVRVMPAC
jgi:hypothetical protein